MPGFQQHAGRGIGFVSFKIYVPSEELDELSWRTSITEILILFIVSKKCEATCNE